MGLIKKAGRKNRLDVARPFLKWAGGKSQLLVEFARYFPYDRFNDGSLTQYVEPFIGGGAVYFLLNADQPFSRCTVCDINEELVLVYRVIQKSLPHLIEDLSILEKEYFKRKNSLRESFYYSVREEFNQNRSSIKFNRYNRQWITRAAQTIFLNHTCYNGLFRVNKLGEFNVPFGRYDKPEILNEANLSNVLNLLKETTILCGDFTKCKKEINDQTFVYLDPPYRPLNQTSSFTSYSRTGFSDEDQKRLARFYRYIDRKGAVVMLSNSDPRNENPSDSFFDDLYGEYTIRRIPAKRMINCNGARRGAVNEILVTNY